MENCDCPGGIIFGEDLVAIDLCVTDKNDALLKMGHKLTELGYVNEDFISAIIKRENEFPTGIKTQCIGVAIPHTEIEYVNQASIFIGVLHKPVVFQQMVSDEDVSVSIVFMLAIKQPEQHLTLLQKLVEVIQDSDTLNSIRDATNKLEITDIIRKKFGEGILY